MLRLSVVDIHFVNLRDKELAYQEQVLTRYRLYSGLFLGLPFERLQRSAQLLPVFAEYCRRTLEQGLDPTVILERFFAETPMLIGIEQQDVLFLFLQLVERQIVLFDAIEDASFDRTHDLDAPGSVTHLAESVARDDMGGNLAKLLQRTATRIVLTAHPTQFYPTTVQGIITDLRCALLARDSAQVERLLLQLGKTRFTNRNRPTPVEEAERVIDVVANVFYEVMPAIVTRAWVTAYGREGLVRHLSQEPNLQIGFWPGGDRDGNPFVTADVTAEVARLLKRRVLACYIESTTALSRRLTFEGAHDSVMTLLGRLKATHARATLGEYKAAFDKTGYDQVGNLISDILALRELVIVRHQGLFVEHIDELLIKVHLFGFYFASLDIRQNCEVFWGTLDELQQLGIFGRLPIAEERSENSQWSLERLEQLTQTRVILTDEISSQLSPLASDTIATLRLIPEIQRSNGECGLHRVIISHAHRADDVLAVLALAHLAGLDSAQLNIDVVPLFESIEDLEAARETLRILLECASYREHLRRRGNRQTVMVGFSDGTKDGGYLTANLAIRQAKRRLTELGRRHQVELVFFDGRGGPPARGGGNTHRFYRSFDLGIDQLHQQLTIQGQTISSNFGSLPLAQHHVEQLFTANLENLLWPHAGEDPPREYETLLDELSSTAHRTYRELRDDPVLLEFLSCASPLPLFDHLTIGSRPVSRKRSARLELEQLRAIPFVATWSVLKMQVPGFYGLGTALESVLEQGREQELRNLYRDSRFFRTLLDNAAMSLLKSRFDVHAYLAEDPIYAALFLKIRDEAERSAKTILRVSQQPRLLANDPINRLSIEMREKIVLPLLVIVQSAYRRYLEYQRAGSENDRAALQLKKLSLKGIAAIINATRNAA